jgi:hypothetical protein
MKIDKEINQLTEAILHEVIEGVAIAIVCEFVIARWKLLEALRGDGGEVTRELGVLNQDHRASRHETIDQRLLPHSRFENTLALTLEN